MNKESSLNQNESNENNSVGARLLQARIGKAQQYRNIVVWPLFMPMDDLLAYGTLDEAIRTQQAQVTEVSEGGSVPSLRVINHSANALLILDGEELIGAKQNRVVNSSMLLPGKSETVIPVSCTEQGRWQHVSKQFHSSDVVMEMKMRRAKMREVSESLKQGEGHSSNQGAIWEDIQALQEKAGHHSKTAAMNEVFQSRETDIASAMETFSSQPGQHGLMVAIDGKVVGTDVVSRADAYGRLHGKLVRSYVLDALLESGKASRTVEDQKAQKFLASIAKCQEERFPAVGCGLSIRLLGKRRAGAALEHEKSLVHVAVFRSEPGAEPKSSGMRSLAGRRDRFRIVE